MLSVSQIKTYNTDGLVKSATQLSSDKVKNLNSALDKYLDCLLYTSPSPRD